jgi:hypothetical protein
MTPRPFLDRLHAEFFPAFQTVPFRPEEFPLKLRAYRQARRVKVEVMQFSKADGRGDDFPLRRCSPGRWMSLDL